MRKNRLSASVGTAVMTVPPAAPASDARVDDPDGVQGAHALTHHGTADGELRGEVTLGGQHVADTQTARDDAVLDPLHDTLVGTPRS